METIEDIRYLIAELQKIQSKQYDISADDSLSDDYRAIAYCKYKRARQQIRDLTFKLEEK